MGNGRDQLIENIPLLFKRQIEYHYNYGHFSIIIGGEQGVGKSRFALINAYCVLKGLEGDYPLVKDQFYDYDTWELIIKKYIGYRPEDLKKIIKECIKTKKRYPIYILDDANVYFNTNISKLPKGYLIYYSMAGLLATIRTMISNLVVTCVDEMELIKPFRQMIFSRGYIEWVDRKNKIKAIKIYKIRRRVKIDIIKRTSKFVYQDKVIPDDVYKEYKEMRDRIFEDASNNFLRALEYIDLDKPEEINKKEVLEVLIEYARDHKIPNFKEVNINQDMIKLIRLKTGYSTRDIYNIISELVKEKKLIHLSSTKYLIKLE